MGWLRVYHKGAHIFFNLQNGLFFPFKVTVAQINLVHYLFATRFLSNLQTFLLAKLFFQFHRNKGRIKTHTQPQSWINISRLEEVRGKLKFHVLLLLFFSSCLSCDRLLYCCTNLRRNEWRGYEILNISVRTFAGYLPSNHFQQANESWPHDNIDKTANTLHVCILFVFLLTSRVYYSV